MKLVYVANNRMPTEKAHGIQISKMCEAFAEQSVEVTLLLPTRRNKIKKNIFDFYGVKKNFKIQKVWVLDTVGLGKWGFLFESLMFAVLTTWKLLVTKVDCVYTRDEMVAYFAARLGKRVIWEGHTGSYNFATRQMLKCVSGIVVITEGLKHFYIDKGVSEDIITVAHDAVDVEEFNISEERVECRERLNLPLDQTIALYTGHLYGWKGVDTLAQASAFLEDVRIVFVGGTESDVKDFREKYKDMNIDVLGHKPHGDMPYYLKAADVLVLPNTEKDTVSKMFTSPMKLFEYMASATPIVASDIPSIREVLDSSNSLLVSPDNPEELALGIREALGQKELSQKAFEDVENYTWDLRAKSILEIC
jgi:glycosyltransferase involved in cell wall biosynthesis